jgi:hypothetical protein
VGPPCVTLAHSKRRAGRQRFGFCEHTELSLSTRGRAPQDAYYLSNFPAGRARDLRAGASPCEQAHSRALTIAFRMS